jgi:hypothetical protein
MLSSKENSVQRQLFWLNGSVNLSNALHQSVAQRILKLRRKKKWRRRSRELD